MLLYGRYIWVVMGVHDKSTIGISLSSSEKHCGDDGAGYDERRVGVAPGG